MISDLPTIDYNELNEIVGFKAPQTVTSERGIAWISNVGWICGKNEMLIEVADGCKYKPTKDVVEILDSEFQKKKAKIEAANSK
jgi:hypothetical protein